MREKGSMMSNEPFKYTTDNSKIEYSVDLALEHKFLPSNPNTIGSGRIVSTNSNPATNRLGKKTLVHSDLQQYQLYMQMKQMKDLGEVIQMKN